MQLNHKNKLLIRQLKQKHLSKKQKQNRISKINRQHKNNKLANSKHSKNKSKKKEYHGVREYSKNALISILQLRLSTLSCIQQQLI